MKFWQAALFVFLLIIGAAVMKREPLMLAYAAAQTPKLTLDKHRELIKSSIVLRLPDQGEGPFPVVLQFHGCSGVHPAHQDQWAAIANDAGYAAMIVDSTGPRGFTREEALEVVCQGKALLGQERAGDVLAAIALAKDDPRLDPARIILAGWSHGGWSVMDFMTMDFAETWPAGVKGEAIDAPAVAGVILFYPYCGPGALSRFRDWTHAPPTLAFVAGQDTIVDPAQCVSYFDRRNKAGKKIDYILYPDAEHIFDNPFLEPQWAYLYNEKYFKDAKHQYRAFLNRLAQ